MAPPRAQQQLDPPHHMSEEKRHILDDHLEDLRSGAIERRAEEIERTEEQRTHRSAARRILPVVATVVAVFAILAAIWIIAAALDDPGPQHAPWAAPSAPNVPPASLEPQ